jgi:phosphonatase-like hydrolase
VTDTHIQLVCLDMAGTTVRDDGIVIKAFAGAMAAVGLEGDELKRAMKYAHDTMGLPKTVVFTDLLGQASLVDQAMAAFDDAIFEVIDQGGVSEMEGARQTLAILGDAGVAVALTTGFSAPVQQAIIKHLGWEDLADMAIAPSPSVRGRPFPDMVLSAALEAKVDDVRQVAVVGDTANDLWSGYRAGASVVAGVLTGSHSRDELQQAPCTHIIGTVAELPGLLGLA